MAKRSDSLAKKPCPGLKCEPDDSEQSAKFIEFVKTIETEDTEERFERAIKRIAAFKPNRQKKAKANPSSR
jgi:hypothetical protein